MLNDADHEFVTGEKRALVVAAPQRPPIDLPVLPGLGGTGRRPSLLAILRRATPRPPTAEADPPDALIEEIREVLNAADAPAPPAAGVPQLPATELHVAQAFGQFVVKVGPAVKLAESKAELRALLDGWVDSL